MIHAGYHLLDNQGEYVDRSSQEFGRNVKEKLNQRIFEEILFDEKCDGFDSCERELDTLCDIKHECLNTINGYWVTGKKNEEKKINNYMAVISPFAKSCLTEYFDNGKEIDIFTVLYGIAWGMEFLNQIGIIHGCLRAENIFLDDKNHPKISNYGIRIIMDKQNKNPEDCVDYMKLKKTAYAPPEIEKSQIFYNAKMDVFSFGILLYELLTKKRADRNNFKIQNGSICPGDIIFHDTIKDFIRRCLSIDPTKRPTFSSIISMFLNKPQNFIIQKDYLNLRKRSIENNKQSELCDMFEDGNQPEDVVQLLIKAFDGDTECCIISVLLMKEKLVLRKGSLDMELSRNKNVVEKMKTIYHDIGAFIYPTKITIPLFSFEKTKLSQAKFKKENRERNINRFQTIAQKAKDPNMLLYVGSIFEEKGEFSKALDLYTESAKYGNPDALIYLGCLKLYLKSSPDFFINGLNITESEIIEHFEAAALSTNVFGMVNYGIMLQRKGVDYYKHAGKFYKMAAELKSPDGQRLYNHAIENGYIDDEASREYDLPKNRWVDWFLSMPVGRIFVQAPKELISMSDKNSRYFQSSHRTVEETVEARFEKEKGSAIMDAKSIKMNKKIIAEKVQDDDLNVANEYGKSIHAAFTQKESDFISLMLDKYLNSADLPRCPRVLCYGQICLPVGPKLFTGNDEKILEYNKNMCVRFYCPRCNDYYLPSQPLYRNVSGIFFPRNYLPNAILNLYLMGKVGRFEQYVPSIYGIPMMKAKERKKIAEYDTDEAGFFTK